MDSKIGLYVKSYLIGIYVLQLALNRDDTCYATIVMYIYGKKHIMCISNEIESEFSFFFSCSFIMSFFGWIPFRHE